MKPFNYVQKNERRLIKKCYQQNVFKIVYIIYMYIQHLAIDN